VTTQDGTPVEWHRDKARELFFYLLHVGAVKSQRVVAELWPNAGPAQGKASLYSAVYAVRKAIDKEAIIAADRTYSVAPDVVVYHDLAEFDRVVAELRVERDRLRRVRLMEAIVELYAGPLLDDFESEWAAVARRTYEMLYLDTLESLVEYYAQEQSWSSCLNAALRGIAIDSDCDAFYLAAADAYRALGKPWAAVRMARRARLSSGQVQPTG
jgi:two-component SAPR family response regulator